MDNSNRNSAIAAAIILAVFGLFAFFLPSLMIAAANYSMVAAIAIAIIFLLAFFVVFWLRARAQRRRGK